MTLLEKNDSTSFTVYEIPRKREQTFQDLLLHYMPRVVFKVVSNTNLPILMCERQCHIKTELKTGVCVRVHVWVNTVSSKTLIIIIYLFSV